MEEMINLMIKESEEDTNMGEHHIYIENIEDMNRFVAYLEGEDINDG